MIALLASIGAFFAPWHADGFALAPDGRHAAYVRAEGVLNSSIVIVDCDHPDAAPVTGSLPAASPESERFAWMYVQAGLPREARPPAAGVQVMWVTSDRLLVNTGADAIVAVEAASGRIRRLADARVLAAAPTPPSKRGPPRPARWVGLDGFGALWVEAQGSMHSGSLERIDPVPTTLFRIDLATGQREAVAERKLGGRAVYDGAPRARLLRTEPGGQKERWLLGDDLLRLPQSEDWQAVLPAADSRIGRIDAATYLGRRAFPVGLDPDGRTLYYASNAADDRLVLEAVDLPTRRPADFRAEDPDGDMVALNGDLANSPLVFDRSRRTLAGVRLTESGQTRWLDPELLALQQDVETRLPGRWVEIVGWSDDRRRCALLARSSADAGRYFVYDRPTHLLCEVARRLPALRRADLTKPRAVRFSVEAAPCRGIYYQSGDAPAAGLVVLLRAGPFSFGGPAFDREAQGLASEGYAVLGLEYPGAGGRGIALRQGLPDQAVEAVASATRQVRTAAGLPAARTVAIGVGYGGFIALRELARHPEEFQDAVAIDAPLDLTRWSNPRDVPPRSSNLSMPKGGKGGKGMGKGGGDLAGGGRSPAPVYDFYADVRRAWLKPVAGELRAMSPALHPESIHGRVMVVQPGRGDVPVEPGRDLAAALKTRGSRYLETAAGYSDMALSSQQEVWEQVLQFLRAGR